MKLSTIRVLTLMLASVALASCGGSSEDNSSDDTETVTSSVNSAELVADENFSFRIDRSITLVIQPATGLTGVANVYSETDSTSPTDDPRPNYLSRLTTIRPDLNGTADIVYTGTEGFLWVEWIPAVTSTGEETLTKVTIDSTQSTYYVDIQ